MDNWDEDCLCDLHTIVDLLWVSTSVVKVYKNLSVITRVDNTSADHKLLLSCVTTTVHDLKHVAVRDTKL